MLKIFITLLLIFKEVTSHATCERCDDDNIPFETFPETKEDLQNICKPGIEYLTCDINNEEKGCSQRSPFDRRTKEAGYNLLATVKEICSEDTLLNAVVVDNLKCFRKLMHEANPVCLENESNKDRGRHFAEALHNKGLILNATHILHECMGLVNFFACESLIVERMCGTVAMRAVSEILQKAGPGIWLGCDEFYQYLPAFIRLRKDEEEKRSEILEAFKKKK